MRRATCLALTISMLMALPVAAQTVAFGGMKADTSAPVELAADNLTVNQTTGKAEFTGNVLIVQGPMRLKADRVEVEYGADRSRIAKLHASGGVTLVSGKDAAEAREAVYEVAAGAVELTGDVLLTQGQNVLSGQHMTIDLKTGTGRMDGRVRTILQPGETR